MRRIVIFSAWAALATGLASPAAAFDLTDDTACVTAGQAAEQAQGIPAGLLISIGKVESGRADPLTGQLTPWPWTVNVDGTGQYFDDKDDAVAFVRLAMSSGAHDVDVGCFQISLEAHPDAFASVEDAFDPVQNANYAAKFLAELKMNSGSWETAVADYHSSTPAFGDPYERLVMARWHGGTKLFASPAVAYAAPDPYVIMQAPAARAVHVYTSDDAAPAWHMTGVPAVYEP